jgi:hypothetical protein
LNALVGAVAFVGSVKNAPEAELNAAGGGAGELAGVEK